MTTTQDAGVVLQDVAPDARVLALSQLRAGHADLAAATLRALVVAEGEPALRWLTNQVVTAMASDQLGLAGDLARINAMLRLGPEPAVAEGATWQLPLDERKLSAGKLRHDIDQFRYLQRIGVLDSQADELIVRYAQIADELDLIGPEARRPPTPAELDQIGDTFGRLTHVRDTPRVDRALSASWQPADVEDRYLGTPPGVVVIDDFLSPQALAGLQAFCLESTVWNANRYPRGRLGSFIDLGFNCPLVLQVAEEIRAAFPRVIGDRHPLRQLWGFKYPPYLPPASTIHADFAAVNVNFWITPTAANRNPDTGGLVVYNTDAPPDWDFHAYNERLDLITEFLRRSRAQEIYIPYRENRAIIFNSDLFHATAEVEFGSDYQDRRINITMLYGVREGDDLHPRLSGAGTPGQSGAVKPSWRSPALRSSRRR